MYFPLAVASPPPSSTAGPETHARLFREECGIGRCERAFLVEAQQCESEATAALQSGNGGGATLDPFTKTCSSTTTIEWLGGV